MSFIDSHLLETIGYYFLNSLKNRPQAGIPSRYSLISRFDSKRLLIFMVVVIFTILIDSEAGLIADFIPEQLSSRVGVAAIHWYSNNICNITVLYPCLC